MFDFSAILRRVMAHLGGEPIVLGASYPLPDNVLQAFMGEGLVSGWIAEGPPPSELARAPGLAGWWVDRSAGLWSLKRTGHTTLVLLGARIGDEISGRMLLEALLAGVRRIVLVDSQGGPVSDLDVFSETVTRLASTSVHKRYGDLTYQNAYADTFSELGDHLRLEVADFVADRVLLLVGSLGPGGAERQVAYTAIGLAAQGLDVVVGCNHLDPPGDFFRPAVEAAGVKIFQVPTHAPEFETPEMLEIRNRLSRYDVFVMNWGLLYAIYHYALLMRTIRPGLVHTWLDYTNVFGGLAAELVGVPALVMGGRSVAPDHFPALYQPYMDAGYRKVIRDRPVTLLNNSHAGAVDYERWLNLPHGAVEVVANGFEFPEQPPPGAREQIRAEQGIDQNALVVGTISRFSEEKNPKLFIDMARVVHARLPKVRFLAFGGGVLFEQMQAYVTEIGLSRVIILAGLTPSPWPALAAMDVMCLTSRMEGLSNVLIEGQAAGLPIVCTAVGGMPETYIEGKTGIGVPGATPEILADSVARLLLEPELRKEMGAAAYVHARATFGLESMVARTSGVYARARERRSLHESEPVTRAKAEVADQVSGSGMKRA